MSEWVSAGKVRMTPKGTYDPTVAYEILDIVTNSSGTASYVAKKAVPAGIVLTNTEYWEVIVDAENSIEDIQEQIDSLEDLAFDAYPSNNASGSIVTFDDGAENVPVKGLEVNINSATAVTSAKITRCGANLADISKITGMTNTTVTFEDGACHIVTYTQAAQYNTYRAANITSANMTYPPGTYYVKFKVKANPTVNAYTCVVLRTIEGNNHMGNYINIVSSDHNEIYYGVFVTSKDCYFSYIGNDSRTGAAYDTDVTIYDLMISKVNILYTPYESDSYTIDWSSTAAGAITSGTLDVTNGKLKRGSSEYDVTPVEIPTLKGYNSIFSNVGDVSVDFRYDPSTTDAGKIEYSSTSQYKDGTIGNTLQNVESTTQKYNLVTAHSRADFVETVGDIASYITVVDDSEGDYNIWVATVEPNKTYFVNTDQEEIEYLFYDVSPIDTTDEGDLGPGGNPPMHVSLRTSRSNIITVSDDVHNKFIAFKSSYTFTEGLVAECFIDVPYKDDTYYTASDQMAREEANYLKSIVYNAYPTDTLSGTKVSFTDGADNIPVKSLKVDLVCTQSGSGDPSPTNYRKINGKDHVYVYISNGNLYNKSTNTVGTMSNDGVVTEDPTSLVEITDFIPVKEDILVEGHIYTSSGSLPMQTVDFCTYDENKQFVRKAGLIFRQNGNGTSGLGLNANEKYVRYTITNANKNNMNYVIRTSMSYNTDWKNEAGSVYRGTVDIVSGTLTVTHKYLEFDGVTNGKKFTTNGSKNTYYLSLADGYTFDINVPNWVSTTLLDNAGVLVSNMTIGTSDDTTVLPHFTAYVGTGIVFQPRIKFDSSITDYTEANAILNEWYEANTPFAIVYPLKTPIVYKIVPTELRTYLGENIINTNTENFTLVYRADPNLFVERKIAEAQN